MKSARASRRCCHRWKSCYCWRRYSMTSWKMSSRMSCRSCRCHPMRKRIRRRRRPDTTQPTRRSASRMRAA